jgi:ParB family chromosome partitioning protein
MPNQSAAAAAPASRRRRFTVDSLFVDHRPQAVGVADLPTAKEIQLSRIEPDADQPRRTFDDAKLAELAASIEIEGVLQPIVVRYDASRGVYVVVHGERRWRASRLAGCTTIPAIVREVPEERRLIQQLMENIIRDDLNAVDRAGALRALKTQLGDVAWEQVAEAVGIRRSRLFQLLGTEKLPDAVRDDIRAGRLSEKQTRALQGLPPGHQEALRTTIVADNLSATEATRLARALRAARIPDDTETATAALASIRERWSVPSSPSDRETTLQLLTAIASSPKPRARASARPDKRSGDASRLDADVRALAETLKRIPPTELQPDGNARPLLVALARALDVLLAPNAEVE